MLPEIDWDKRGKPEKSSRNSPLLAITIMSIEYWVISEKSTKKETLAKAQRRKEENPLRLSGLANVLRTGRVEWDLRI
jgi:hypothetical protein